MHPSTRPIALGLAAASLVLAVACSGEEGTPTSAAAGAGGSTTGSTTTTSTTGSTSATTSGSTTSGTASTSVSTGSGSGGTGGSGGDPWPTCDAQPADVPTKTLGEIWQDDPARPTPVWVPGVYVTAVSRGGCVADSACQIFVQQAESYATLAAGAQQSLKIFVSANTATHFTAVAVNDRVDVHAHAWRYDVDGQRELLLQVNLQLPGCAKKVGTGEAVPTPATLADLTVAAYEDTLGPLFVQVSSVSGKPQAPDETFALWQTGVFSDAGIEEVVSLSPFFIDGSVFTGLAADQVHQFDTIAGVFGLFMPPAGDAGTAVKYKEIYPRAMSDVVIGAVQP